MTISPPPRTYRVKSFGCQMNVYDGERMGEVLGDAGLSSVGENEEADVVVLNTCHIRERATEKVYSDIGRLRRADGSLPLIAVAGCVAQAEGEEIMARAPQVRMVVGPQAYHHLPDMLARAVQGERVTDTRMPVSSKFAHLPERKRAGPTAFLTVQEGCDKFCTYCVVPYTRGAEVSRPFTAILAEADRLIEAGAQEITLLGQNVNGWKGEDASGCAIGLDGLIRALAGRDIARIRYITSHPADMTDALIEAHASIDKLMPFLHLPVQSGSDTILKAMNRSHTAETYLKLIEKMRSVRPDIAISGDFIVGFPGESDQDFADTLALIDAVSYAQAYSFKYSPRPGTPAAAMDMTVAPDIVDDRLQRLQTAINRDQLAFNEASLGRRCAVLVERRGKHAGQWLGKSPWLQSVHFDGDAKVGDMVDVRFVEARASSMHAVLTD